MYLRKIITTLVIPLIAILPLKGQLLSSLYANSADITIDNAMVSGSTDLNNFVLLISLEANSSTTSADVLSNGFDIVFAPNSASSVGSEYKHDLESYNGSTGELIIWVQVDLSATVDTDLTMFYGRSGVVTDPSDASLWSDANYIGVWQLSETPGASAIVDATGNSPNGSSFGDVAVDGSSVVGQGYSFDGTGDYVLIPENATIEPTSSFTISCWFNTAGTQNNYAKMFAKGETGAPYASYTLEMRPNNGNTNHDEEVGFQTGRQNGNFVLTDSNGNGQIDITPGEWNYFAGVIDDAGGPSITQRFYLNGDEISSSTAETASSIDYYTGTYDLAIAGIYDGGINNEFQGTIDELRLANVVRTEDYLRTEVRNTACVSNYMTISGITGLSCTDVSLPIKLEKFVGKRVGKDIVIVWETASEKNNSFFTLEKSQDGKIFQPIATIDGAGNSNSIKHYTYADKNVTEKLMYYRLKQTDFDGTFEYSRIEKVIGAQQGSSLFVVFPNPVGAEGVVTFTLSDFGSQSAVVYVRNLSGQIVMRKYVKSSASDGYFREDLDLTTLPKGSYILNVLGKHATFTEKLFVR